MDKLNYTVYAHISPNGKYYIGITKQKVNRRWRKGKGYIHNAYFYNAIQKYGWDNFQHAVIASGITREEAINFEIILIDKLDTMNREFGYNRTEGGEGQHGTTMSEERKVFLSEKMTGKGNHMYGISLDGMTGKDNPMYAKPAYNRRKVRCINTGEIFNAITHGAKKYKTHRADISKVCKGKRNYAGTLNGQPIRWEYV